MMRFLVFGLALFAGSAYAACPTADQLPDNSFCLEWAAPTENDNGTPLTDLASYRIYYGFATRDYASHIPISDPTSTDHQGETDALNLPDGWETGEVFFTMTALDDDGNESGWSNEVFRTVTVEDTTPPNPPIVLDAVISINLQ